MILLILGKGEKMTMEEFTKYLLKLGTGIRQL